MRPDHTGEYVALLILIVGLIALCALQAAAYHTMPAGRHRAPGRATRREDRRTRAGTEASRDAKTAFIFLSLPTADEFDRPAIGGAGRYAHLRTDELDATAERALLLAERGLRPVSVWGTPVDDDVWEMAA